MQPQGAENIVTAQDWRKTGLNDGRHGNPRLTLAELGGGLPMRWRR